MRIGVGRDAAEIAFSTPFGEMTPTDMAIRIDRADGAPEAGERTVAAIATAVWVLTRRTPALDFSSGGLA